MAWLIVAGVLVLVGLLLASSLKVVTDWHDQRRPASHWQEPTVLLPHLRVLTPAT